MGKDLEGQKKLFEPAAGTTTVHKPGGAKKPSREAVQAAQQRLADQKAKRAAKREAQG